MKRAVIFGAGNIGRGFIGQLFSQSGFQVTFIEVDPVLLENLNKRNSYSIKIVSEDETSETIVSNVKGIHSGKMAEVAAEIVKADIMATAVGVNVLPKIIKPLILGFCKRWETGNDKPLNIIICENLIDADEYLTELIQKELTLEQNNKFQNTIGLIKASIGRMVPEVTEEMKEGDPLKIWVEPYSKLPVDRDGFKGSIPEIKNMVPFSPFKFYIQRKLFMHNMAHAITAYLGQIAGYTYIWEAIEDARIRYIVSKALQESALALSQEHKVAVKELLSYADDLIFRFNNKLLGDTLLRVGRDPLRKLSEQDRLVGAAKLCLRQEIYPVYILTGLAAGYLFKSVKDKSAQKVQSIVAENGIEEAIKRVSALKGDKFQFLSIIKDFYFLLKEDGIKDIYKKAEKAKYEVFLNKVNL